MSLEAPMSTKSNLGKNKWNDKRCFYWQVTKIGAARIRHMVNLVSFNLEIISSLAKTKSLLNIEAATISCMD